MSLLLQEPAQENECDEYDDNGPPYSTARMACQEQALTHNKCYRKSSSCVRISGYRKEGEVTRRSIEEHAEALRLR